MTKVRQKLARVDHAAKHEIALADSARDRHDWSLAATHYAAALALDSRNAAIWVQLGNMEKEAGRFAEAANAYARAAELKVADDDVHLQTGHLRKLMGDLGGAAEAYRRSLSLNPANFYAYDELERLGLGREAEGILAATVQSAAPGSQLIFDVSDLVYYIGHHAHLTGIQRVQCCIIMAVVKYGLYNRENIEFISFDNTAHSFRRIDPERFLALISDLTLPEGDRTINFDQALARRGQLFPAGPLTNAVAAGNSTIVLLGAAWVIPDYPNMIANLKRRFGVRFVMLFHDLIPVYARETCDQGTANVFRLFLDQIIEIVDLALCVSRSTESDLFRYCKDNRFTTPQTAVTRLGSGFAEFLPDKCTVSSRKPIAGTDDPFVLFVSTIEGRKNHEYMLRIWRNLSDQDSNVPRLVCVGRFGWRSDGFLHLLMETEFLNGRVEILQDVSDSQLSELYDSCMFTVYPSLYEGWGLPVSESLAHGKLCVMSDRTSLPEVAGDLGVYIPLDDIDAATSVVRDLIHAPQLRAAREADVRANFCPVTWKSVAERVLEACENVREAARSKAVPHIVFGKEYLLRSLRNDAADAVGNAMMEAAISAHRGHILRPLIAPRQKIMALAARDDRWCEAEPWGCWSRGPSAGLDIGLDLRTLKQKEEFILLYAAVEFPPYCRPLSMSAWVKGSQIGVPARISSDEHVLAWQLPLSVLRDCGEGERDGITAVSIEFRAHFPTGFDLGAMRDRDARLPVIGLRSFAVIAESDLSLRLQIAEDNYFAHFTTK